MSPKCTWIQESRGKGLIPVQHFHVCPRNAESSLYTYFSYNFTVIFAISTQNITLITYSHVIWSIFFNSCFFQGPQRKSLPIQNPWTLTNVPLPFLLSILVLFLVFQFFFCCLVPCARLLAIIKFLSERKFTTVYHRIVSWTKLRMITDLWISSGPKLPTVPHT